MRRPSASSLTTEPLHVRLSFETTVSPKHIEKQEPSAMSAHTVSGVNVFLIGISLAGRAPIELDCPGEYTIGCFPVRP